MTGSSEASPSRPFDGAAFVTEAAAAAYLGLSGRSVRKLVQEGRLRRVYPRPRSSRITAESLLAYRAAVEAGETPRTWTQPGNPHSAVPQPETQTPKKGFLNRWLSGD